MTAGRLKVQRSSGRACSLSRMPLYPSEPLVALIFPIAATRLSQEIHLGQVLHLLVAELHGRVEADRGAVVGHQVLAVHPVGEKSLLVERTLPVPRGPVPRVKR